MPQQEQQEMIEKLVAAESEATQRVAGLVQDYGRMQEEQAERERMAVAVAIQKSDEMVKRELAEAAVREEELRVQLQQATTQLTTVRQELMQARQEVQLEKAARAELERQLAMAQGVLASAQAEAAQVRAEEGCLLCGASKGNIAGSEEGGARVTEPPFFPLCRLRLSVRRRLGGWRRRSASFSP